MAPGIWREAGFTLVEAILSMVVLGVALVPVVNLFAQAAERHTLPDEVIASNLAAAKMEEVIACRALNGWTAVSTPTSCTPVYPTIYADVDGINFPNYQWRVEVVNVAQNDFITPVALGSTLYKRITVFVKKPDSEEPLKLVTIVTSY